MHPSKSSSATDAMAVFSSAHILLYVHFSFFQWNLMCSIVKQCIALSQILCITEESSAPSWSALSYIATVDFSKCFHLTLCLDNGLICEIALTFLAIWITVWICLSSLVVCTSRPPSACKGVRTHFGSPFTVFGCMNDALQVPAVQLWIWKTPYCMCKALESVWVQSPDTQTPVCMHPVSRHQHSWRGAWHSQLYRHHWPLSFWPVNPYSSLLS